MSSHALKLFGLSIGLCGVLTGCSLERGVDGPDLDTRERGQLVESACTDGKDDDLDGLVDCIDPECATASACSATLDCGKAIYQIRDATGEVVVYNTAVNPFTFTSLGALGSQHNAAGYNSKDGHIYAIRNSDRHLIRVDHTSPTTVSGVDLGAVTNLPTGGQFFYAADFDINGVLWVSNGSLYQINMSSSPPVATAVGGAGFTPSDMAYNPDQEKFYGVDGNTLTVYDVPTKTATTRTITGATVSGTGTHGAIWFDADGAMFAYQNSTGYVRRILLDSMTGTTVAADFVGTGPASGQNDGASCPFAGPPFEVCGNGRDDDGDGTVDENGNRTTPGANTCVDLRDSDGDGVPNVDDLDDDNDGIPDVYEDGDTDRDGVPDRLDLDSDNDGVLDVVEAGHDALDTNKDGILAGPYGQNGLVDALETAADSALLDYDSNGSGGDSPRDTDGDGIPDFHDLDSDSDGLSDLLEAGYPSSVDINNDGVVEDGTDTDGDGIQDLVDGKTGAYGDDDTALTLPDGDSDGRPDLIEVDSDSDGLFDIFERGPAGLDQNADGKIDTLTDSDGDGIADVVDAILPGFGGLKRPDADGDGLADTSDLDDDDDGILDTVEGDSDLDGDGLPNRLDLESDGDGIADVTEAGHSAASTAGRLTCAGGFGTNGLCDALETAVDSGVVNYTLRDTDGDAAPDYRDLDADNDSLNDVRESGPPGGEDANGDGFLDPLNSGSPDADGDGLVDRVDPNNGGQVLTPIDSDGDGTPDYRDLDSDNDSLGDFSESGNAGTDADNDGVLEGADTDGDGIFDSADGLPASFGDSGDAPPRDQDAAGGADYIDLDSDGDATTDIDENGFGNLDANDDGRADGSADADSDGILDALDKDDAQFGGIAAPVPDSDGDGVHDDTDLDDDNDGVLDSVEGVLDSDGEAVLNRLDLDSDGDGLTDALEAGHGAALTNARVTCAGGFGTNGFCDALETSADSSVASYSVRDADGDGAPDFLDLDSDDDSINDVREGGGALGVDANGDGFLDALGSGPSDSDVDGLVDRADVDDGGVTLAPADSDSDGLADVLDLDSDNDALSDLLESGATATDANDNGVVDGTDTDGDGIRDSADGAKNSFGDAGDIAPQDRDGTGDADYLDLDSDDDGENDIAVALSEGLDVNDDGRIDVATDADDDGIADVVDDSDGDGVVDASDPGSGAFGGLKKPTIPVGDSDGDGVKDDADLDDDNDGIPDALEGGGDTDGDAILDSRDLDSDNDGVLDLVEAGHGGIDANGDGVVDGGYGTNGLADALETTKDSGEVEYGEPADADEDGRSDFRDLDSDNDGIVDLIEAGLPTGEASGSVDVDDNGMVDGTDADGDGILSSVDGALSVLGDQDSNLPERDTDGDGFADRVDLDSDADGKDDVDEAGLGALDKNGDGRVDGKVDDDSDGVLDSVDDSDGDGTPDEEDGDLGQFGTAPISLPNTDGDSIPDPFDPKGTGSSPGDSDSDGKSDSEECELFPACPDGDGDGTPDYAEESDRDGDDLVDSKDLDSDGDGIPNALENLLGFDPYADSDKDGVANFLDADDRGDGQSAGCVDAKPKNGICDVFGATWDTDGDSVGNHLDLDADNDGIVDAIESGSAGVDLNGDALVDGPAGQNGLADGVETTVDSGSLKKPLLDTDGDKTPDFLDLDSDNDGDFDLAEVPSLAALDGNGDGKIDDTTDKDGDGILGDADDKDNTYGFPALEGLPSASGDDPDGDGIPSPYDPRDDGSDAGDSDGDGLDDLTECPNGWPCPDGNSDGIPDYNDADLDDDGISDGEDDDDDDGDTLKDTEENGLGIDPDADHDDDGIPNFQDATDRGDGEPALCVDDTSDGRCDVLDPLFDSDGDGRPTHRDTDDDDDTILTKTEVEDGGKFGNDVDSDGKPNWLDTDSDGDGLFDADEGTEDSDGDGVPDYLDPQSPPDDVDSDGDGEPDASDPDDDNDTVLDVEECEGDAAGECDTDGDGKPNRVDDDDDNDGIPTKTERGDGDIFGSDVDDDGNKNWLDTDADGDELLDTDEYGNDDDVDGRPDYLDADPGGFSGGACGCKTGPTPNSGAWWLVSGLAGYLALRRRRRNVANAFRAGIFGLFAAIGVSGRASAESVELNQFRPSERADEGFAVSRATTPGHLKFGAQLYLDYAMNPLVYEERAGDPSTERYSIVGNQLTIHAGLSLGLTKYLLLFAGLPVNGLMDGEDNPILLQADGAGIGDVQVGARARLLGDADDVFALALQATLGIPTAQLATTQSFAGDPAVNFIPEALLELRPGGIIIGLNAGARIREQGDLGPLGVKSELLYGLGVTVPLKRSFPRLNAYGELHGASSFDEFPSRAQSPMESIFGLKFLTQGGWAAGLGAGPGFGRGYGTPDVRILAMFGFAAQEAPKALPPPVLLAPQDPDHDGIVGTNDKCPNEPEDKDSFEDSDGCPDLDNDQDGVLDVSDGAPLDPEDKDSFEDTDGVPEPDNDKDGLFDAGDKCPNEPEDKDSFEDEDGCPDPDNDKDTVLDVGDKCPETPGAPEDEGCPKMVRIEKGRIVILKRVEFASGKAVILKTSDSVLQDVLTTLESEDSILKVRVEGHTDAKGTDTANLDLSRRRAASVKRWFLDKGVSPSRIEAWGCGEVLPLSDNNTEAGRQENRRVEFHILDPAPDDGPRSPSGCVEAE